MTTLSDTPDVRQPARPHRCAVLALAASLAAPALATADDAASARWIASWTASPQTTWGADFAFPTNLPDSPLSNYYDTGKDALRREINRWIRTSGTFDEVIDFDALLRDPAHPSRPAPAFDSGDHLHPGDVGNAAMAAALASAPRLDGPAR